MWHAATKYTSQLRESFTIRTFLQGLGFVALAYATLACFIWINGKSYIEERKQRLASLTVLVEYEKKEEEKPIHTVTRTLPNPFKATENKPQEEGSLEQPQDTLAEETKDGKLPVINTKTGQTPFETYKRPFKKTLRPKISLVIADLGLSDSATESAIRTMPPEVSLVLSPYAENPDFWANEARARGHEIWLTLPVEGKDFPKTDTGPYTMIIDAPERENIRKLKRLMARTQGYVGFVTSDDPVFIKSLHDMRPVIGDIYNRGLAFVDTSKEPSITPMTMANGRNAPYGAIDLIIDEKPEQSDILAALEKLEKIAKDKGKATAIIRPFPVSYQTVLEWVKTLEKKDILLAPLSASTGS